MEPEKSPSVSRWFSRQRQTILHTMNSFRKTRTFCDVVLLVEDRRLAAHTVVLAASSPYFKTRFTSDLTQEQERHELEVKLPEFDPSLDRIEELLNFVYTGEIEMTDKNVGEMLALADFYDIANLKELCAQFLRKRLKPANCLSTQMLADRYHHEPLFKTATNFISSNLNSIWQEVEFKSLDIAEVKKLFSGQRLAIKTQEGEEEIFEGLKTWVKHDLKNRESYVAELLQCVRLSAMSNKFLLDLINHDELVTRSCDCQSLIATVLGVTESIVLVSENGCASSYIPATEAWIDLARLPSYNKVRAVTTCKGFVYAIGWEDDRFTIEKFDPENNLWSQILWDRRNRPIATVSIGDSIYVLQEQIVSRFNAVDHSWEDVAGMTSVRRGLCAVALNGHVYAIGGHERLKPLGLNSVEKYDPERDQWEAVASMDEQRCFASAAVVGNKIFVVGGTGNCFLPLSNCELYDPVTDMWSLLQAELNVPRSNAAVGKAKKKIFVFGGTYTNGIVEYYDGDKGEWKEIGRIPSTMNFTHACVTWLPKGLFKSLKSNTLLCDQEND